MHRRRSCRSSPRRPPGSGVGEVSLGMPNLRNPYVFPFEPGDSEYSRRPSGDKLFGASFLLDLIRTFGLPVPDAQAPRPAKREDRGARRGQEDLSPTGRSRANRYALRVYQLARHVAEPRDRDPSAASPTISPRRS